jgi:cytidine deaminase
MTDRQLIACAQKASENAYVPYSRFRVGAALECTDGTVFTGCNVENAALGCTVCAERTAILKAVSEGHREFRCIAIYADSPDYCYPCGTCRQVIREFSPELEVLCARGDGRYVSYRIDHFLPHAFGPDHMK